MKLNSMFPVVLLMSQFPFALASGPDVRGNQNFRDESVNLDFINMLPLGPSILPSTGHLCACHDSDGTVSKPNTKTIREFLGPTLKSVEILQVTNFETLTRFYIASEAIANILQKSPKLLFRHEPWANSVNPDYVARLNFADGKSGEILATDSNVCFQDHDGKRWWARFASPEDLNLITIQGMLKFESGHGCFIEEKGGHRIWLQTTENKVLAHELEALLNNTAIVTGELRKVPNNVTMSIPAGGDYFTYGFTIAPVFK